jgi:hypothetical protein
VPNTSSPKACIQHGFLSSQGHFLWVTFLLGQQKKSDSAFGRRSKRPLRKRPGRDIANPEGQEQSHWMTSPSAVEKRLLPSQE